jgi:hypothetical protein
MQSKVCSKCKVDKSIDQFTKRYDRPIGVRPWCRECQRSIDAKSRETDKGKKKYRKQIWKKAGIDITYEQYKEKYQALEGKCEICYDQLPSLCVDHNHATGEVRGLLCTPCNLAIENLKESPEIMSNAIKYIKKYGGRNV